MDHLENLVMSLNDIDVRLGDTDDPDVEDALLGDFAALIAELQVFYPTLAGLMLTERATEVCLN